MPAQYEKIRDSEVARGVPYDEAQRIGAATFNKMHPNHPMRPDPNALRREALLKQMGKP